MSSVVYICRSCQCKILFYKFMHCNTEIWLIHTSTFYNEFKSISHRIKYLTWYNSKIHKAHTFAIIIMYILCFCTFSSLYYLYTLLIKISISTLSSLTHLIQNLVQLKDETPQNMSLNLNQHQQRTSTIFNLSIVTQLKQKLSKVT